MSSVINPNASTLGNTIEPSEMTLGANVGTWLTTPSGANLAAALTTALPESKGGTGLTALGTGVGTALGIAPNAAGGFSTLRKFTGSASLNGLVVTAGGTLDVPVTVTGAAAGDAVSFSYPFSGDQGSVALSAITVTTNTVTFTFVTTPDSLGTPMDAGWGISGNTLYVSIIK